MAEVFAGFVCGFGLALVVAPLAAVAIVRARTDSPFIQRAAPEGTNVVALSILLWTLAFYVLTAAGMLFGLMLYGLEDRRPEGGLGSPTLAYTALILSITAIAVLPVAVAAPRWRSAILASGLVFAVTFGWLVPYLSLIGPSKN